MLLIPNDCLNWNISQKYSVNATEVTDSKLEVVATTWVNAMHLSINSILSFSFYRFFNKVGVTLLTLWWTVKAPLLLTYQGFTAQLALSWPNLQWNSIVEFQCENNLIFFMSLTPFTYMPFIYSLYTLSALCPGTNCPVVSAVWLVTHQDWELTWSYLHSSC